MIKEERRAPTWPRQTVAVALALLALFFLAPLLMLEGDAPPEPLPAATLPAEVVTPTPPASATPIPGWDAARQVRLKRSDGSVEELSLEEYLWGVVAAEMPASFHTEALKAQAVCARTYCVHQQESAADKHPDADVCTDYTCCQAWLTRAQAAEGWGEEAARYADKVTSAVRETDGLLCLYGGEPIDAVFFSSAAGQTVAAAEVWGSQVPYLTSVASPEGEEVPGWQTVVSFPAREFAQRFTASCPQADFSGPVETWVGEVDAAPTGRVREVTIGGVAVTGAQARAILGLRSANFTVSAEPDKLTFSVTGYGHGVGLSQYGANALAGEGKDFEAILKWYYTGITVAGIG